MLTPWRVSKFVLLQRAQVSEACPQLLERWTPEGALACVRDDLYRSPLRAADLAFRCRCQVVGEFNTSGPEIAYFQTYVEAGQPALDLACGTGR
jgi:hypothetical protein